MQGGELCSRIPLLSIRATAPDARLRGHDGLEFITIVWTKYERPLLHGLQLRPILRKVRSHATCFRIGKAVCKPTNAVSGKHGSFFSLHAAVWRTGKGVRCPPVHPHASVFFDCAFQCCDCT